MTCSSPVNPQIQGRPVPDHRLTFRDQRRPRPQPDRRPGRFSAVRLSHLEADELPNSGDPQGIGSRAAGLGDAQPAAGGLRPV
jgi:hypothetical protein